MNWYISETIKDYIPILCLSLNSGKSYILAYFRNFEYGSTVFISIILISTNLSIQSTLSVCLCVPYRLFRAQR